MTAPPGWEKDMHRLRLGSLRPAKRARSATSCFPMDAETPRCVRPQQVLVLGAQSDAAAADGVEEGKCASVPRREPWRRRRNPRLAGAPPAQVRAGATWWCLTPARPLVCSAPSPGLVWHAASCSPHPGQSSPRRGRRSRRTPSSCGRRRVPRPQRPVAGVRLLRSRDRKRRRSQAFPRRSTAVAQALTRPVAAGAALHRRAANTAWLLT